jgi:antitoxin CcdA
VRQDLITEAKEFGTNISAVLERALEAEHREHKRRQWRQENAAAIQTLNLWVEENGVPFADLRPW